MAKKSKTYLGKLAKRFEDKKDFVEKVYIIVSLVSRPVFVLVFGWVVLSAALSPVSEVLGQYFVYLIQQNLISAPGV